MWREAEEKNETEDMEIGEQMCSSICASPNSSPSRGVGWNILKKAPRKRFSRLRLQHHGLVVFDCRAIIKK